MKDANSPAPSTPPAAKRWPGLALAVLVGLLAAQPLLFGRLAAGSDTYFHIHRLWQLHDLISRGVAYSRWAPDLPFGFGTPVFNYYAPASYYLAELGYRITGALVPGYMLALIAIIVTAAAGVFLWLRDIVDERAALAAAAAFVFAPYPIANIYSRGAIAEPLAAAMMPFVMWGLHRLIKTHRPIFIPATAVAFGALALSHNVTIFLFAPFAAAYAVVLSVWQARQVPEQHRPFGRSMLLSALALGWGAALAAFFIGPAFLERGSIQLERIYNTFFYDYHHSFQSLADFFVSPAPLDRRLISGAPKFFVGAAPAALAALGLLGLIQPNASERRMHTLYATLGSAICVFMAIPASLPVWESVPLLRVLQFPARWLMPNSLFMAVLIGAGVDAAVRLIPKAWAWLQAAVALAAMAGLIATVLPMLLVLNPFPVDYAPTGLTIAQLEKQYNVIGTTNTGEYLPVTVKQIPELEQSPLTHAGQRLDPGSVPGAATIVSEAYGPLAYDIGLDTPVAFDAVIRTFYFPGWVATVDGAEAAIQPADPSGFISIRVPAGQHHVRVQFGSTPLRRFSEALSLAALAALGIASVAMTRRARAASPLMSQSIPLPRAQVVGTGVVLVVMFGFKALVVDQRETPWSYTRFDGQQVSGLSHPANINFNNALVFLGAELPAQAPADERVNVKLYWRAAGALKADYSVGVQVVDRRGVLAGQSDHQHPSETPTTVWLASQYARDEHEVALFPGTPPGEYSVRVKVYPYGAPDQPQPIVANADDVSGLYYTVGKIQVARSRTKISSDELGMGAPVNRKASPGVTLLGYDAPAAEVRTGDRVPVVLYWRADAALAGDAQFHFKLSGAGAQAATSPAPLVLDFPTPQWQPNDIWRAPHTLLVPPALASGAYTLALQVDEGAPLTLGVIHVSAQQHNLTPPQPAATQSARFGEVAELVGYTVAPGAAPGQPLAVTLHWRAIGETALSYKVFVHLLDAQGSLISGDDSAPAGWTRPTTGWVPGEYITDTHTLNLPAGLPAGGYRLQIGLYEEEGANQRLGEPVTLGQAVEVK